MDDVLDTITETEVLLEPVVEEVAPAVEPIAETPAVEPEQKQPGFVPLAAMLDERDKRKAAEQGRQALEDQLKAREAPVTVPDPYDDPEGYNQHTQRQIDQMMTAQRFNTSALIAKQAHGVEAVDAAAQWAEERAKTDPSFASMYMREEHPIEWIVQQHKRDNLVSQLPNDVSSLDELIEREIAKRGLTAPIAAQPAVKPVLKSAEPPRSIASDASPANNAIIDPNADFDAIFDRR